MCLRLKTICSLLALVALVGCVVIEKKNLVLIVPANSNEILVYYTFEGMSVLDADNSTITHARSDLTALSKDKFSFFYKSPDNSLNKFCRFEALRYYSDPSRARSLCADRRMTIIDREAFGAKLSQDFNDAFNQNWANLSEKQILENIRNARIQLQRDEALEGAKTFGMGPFINALKGVAELANCLDLESVKKIKSAIADDFRWLRFEDDKVRLIMPCTAEIAKQIVENPKAKDWEKEMETLVKPVKLEVCVEGVSITVGRKGTAIRLSYTDDRRHRPENEADLATSAGSPKPIIMADGSQVSAEKLIQMFIEEKSR